MSGTDFKFDESIICPDDPTASPGRIRQYHDYYSIKYEICKSAEPKRIAEIGVRAGYSAWAFLQAAPEATYYGFDANNGKHGGQGGQGGCFWKWAKNILQPYNVFLVEMNTQQVERLPVADIDFFHVDGDHSEAGVKHDLDLAWASLSRYGVILIDDIDYVMSVKVGASSWIQNKGKQVACMYYESLRGEAVIWKK